MRLHLNAFVENTDHFPALQLYLISFHFPPILHTLEISTTSQLSGHNMLSLARGTAHLPRISTCSLSSNTTSPLTPSRLS